MKKQKIKIPFEILAQIKELSNSLPKVPYLITNAKGKVIIQEIKKNEILEQRLMNHKVNLISAYQQKEQLGLDQYIAYVEGLDQQIREMNRAYDELNKQKEVKIEEQTLNVNIGADGGQVGPQNHLREINE